MKVLYGRGKLPFRSSQTWKQLRGGRGLEGEHKGKGRMKNAWKKSSHHPCDAKLATMKNIGAVFLGINDIPINPMFFVVMKESSKCP